MVGKVPKTYAVRSDSPLADTKVEISDFVKQHKSSHNWLAGGQKNPSRKVLRRFLWKREELKDKSLSRL